MERLAIFVNDAHHAQQLLEPLLASQADMRCTLVLCPPRLTHRIGKWLSNRQRQQWQRTWAGNLQRELTSRLPASSAGRLEWTVAGGRLADTTARLRRTQGTGLQMLDIRKPHTGQSLPPIDPTLAAPGSEQWRAPLAVSSSLAVVLSLVD